jgi:hypothetical protein
MASYSATIVEGLALDEGTPVRQPVLVVEGPRVHDTPFPTRGVAMSQGMGVHPAIARQYAGGGLVSESIRLAPVLAPLGKYRRTIAQALVVNAELDVARALALVQGLTIQEVRVVQRALHLIQALALKDTLAPKGLYHKALAESVHINAGFAKFLGAAIVQGFSFHPTLDRQYVGAAGVVENLAVSGMFAGTLLFRVDLTEELDITPLMALRGVYHGSLQEGLNLWVAYIDPGGGSTTWAINTRTNAVTEYQNYVFNSITKLGHKFLGADGSGLWELNGELDGDLSIPTRIKSGWMQITGSKFTSFKAAYLGLKVKDDATDFILKLHSGDGREYVYAVRPNNMATTKVKMGKGLRARYFAFELVTLGADYDLDNVEFVPISSGRRV